MNVFMMTLLYPREQYNEVVQNMKDKLQNQINSYQYAFIEGIQKNLKSNERLSIFNSLPVGVFPSQYRKLFLKKGTYDNDTMQQSGCINLPWFKQKMRSVASYRAVLKWAKENPKNRTVLVYTQYLPYLRGIMHAKKRFPSLKATIIVTDLPNELGLPSGRKGLLKKIEYYLGKRSLELLRQMDGFVLLTDSMADALQLREKPYTVIEGLILSQPNVQAAAVEGKTRPYFLYTGTLEKSLGVMEMLSAFSEMPEYDLHICGHGNMKAEVEKYTKRFDNIHFHGFVAQEKALALQAGAAGLLNPRQPDGLFTRYSFPSKTLEYMRSGRPVLCCKLEGIPADYDPYLCYMEPGKDGIIRSVRSLMELSTFEREQMGESAHNYVLDFKNPEQQCRKLVDLLRRIYTRTP